MDYYNRNAQFKGLIAVLVVSALGVGFALSVQHLARSKAAILFVVLFKGIGVGVIISTAWIHLINEAYDGFIKNSLLPGDYDAWPIVFALAAIWIMACSDFFFSRDLSDRSSAVDEFDPEALLALSDNSSGNIHSQSYGSITAQKPPNGNHNITEQTVRCFHGEDTQSFTVRKNQARQRVYIAEASIVIHSIMIGIDVGIQYEEEYASILIAILFHQFFEGFGLGQMLQSAGFESTFKIALMSACFSLTTPFGILVGMLVHKDFDKKKESDGTRLAVSILNSFCGGVLLYLGLVNLLSSWFIDNRNLMFAPLEFGASGLLGILIGFVCMAVIGIWE